MSTYVGFQESGRSSEFLLLRLVGKGMAHSPSQIEHFALVPDRHFYGRQPDRSSYDACRLQLWTVVIFGTVFPHRIVIPYGVWCRILYNASPAGWKVAVVRVFLEADLTRR